MGGGRWRVEAAMLRANPGKWLPLATRNTPAHARATASQVNRGLLHAFAPAGSYEAIADGLQVRARYRGLT